MTEQEYFATGTEAWFASTVRSDVNGGVRTREGLRERDVPLAAVLEAAFGDGPWRFPQDCPRELRMPTRRDRGLSDTADKQLCQPGENVRREEGERGPCLSDTSDKQLPLYPAR